MGTVLAVCKSDRHTMRKFEGESIRLLAGLGVEGDAHAGRRVKHRYLVRKDPNQVNLRQVHLIQSELFEDLAAQGFSIEPGQMGENITTKGLDLLSMAQGTILHIGAEARLEITGLRTPCKLLDRIQEGLMSATLERHATGVKRKAGVMSLVLRGGIIRPGDAIRVELPDGELEALQPV